MSDNKAMRPVALLWFSCHLCWVCPRSAHTTVGSGAHTRERSSARSGGFGSRSLPRLLLIGDASDCEQCRTSGNPRCWGPTVNEGTLPRQIDSQDVDCVVALTTDGAVVSLDGAALAFVAGYNADLLFRAIERVSGALLPKAVGESSKKQAVQRTPLAGTGLDGAHRDSGKGS